MDRTVISVLVNNLDIEALEILYTDGSDDVKKEIDRPENIRLLVQRLGFKFLSDYNEEYNRLKALYVDNEEKLQELEDRDMTDETIFDGLDRQAIKTFDDVIGLLNIIEKRKGVYDYIASYLTPKIFKTIFKKGQFYPLDGYHELDYDKMLKSQWTPLSAENAFGSPEKINMLFELIISIEDDEISTIMTAGHKSIETQTHGFMFINGRLSLFT